MDNKILFKYSHTQRYTDYLIYLISYPDFNERVTMYYIGTVTPQLHGLSHIFHLIAGPQTSNNPKAEIHEITLDTQNYRKTPTVNVIRIHPMATGKLWLDTCGRAKINDTGGELHARQRRQNQSPKIGFPPPIGQLRNRGHR